MKAGWRFIKVGACRSSVLQEDAPEGLLMINGAYREAVCNLTEGEELFAELLRCFVNSCVKQVSLRGADFGVECTLCTC